MGWHVFAASATGSSHVETGLPCQDAFAYEVVGKVLCAVVCDGAGSTVSGDRGAQHVAQRVVQELAERTRQNMVFIALPTDELKRELLALITQVRSELQAQAEAAGANLADYATTLVGVIATSKGGWMFHIGDGLAVAEPRAGDRSSLVSLPENGEYANETYFVTCEEWQEHLRLQVIDEPLQTLALMSDGAMPFVMDRGLTGLFRPFFDPVERFLNTATQAAGNRALAGVLDDPRTHAITSDDKTLLIAQWRK